MILLHRPPDLPSVPVINHDPSPALSIFTCETDVSQFGNVIPNAIFIPPFNDTVASHVLRPYHLTVLPMF
jgi:hypothetical protein